MPGLQTERKTYSSPRLNKLTPGQAKLLLIGQATKRDQGAKDLLDMVFPDPNELGNVSPHIETVSPRIDGEKPGGFVTKPLKSTTSRLLIRAVMPSGRASKDLFVASRVRHWKRAQVRFRLL